VLDSLSRALRLDQVESAHLRDLAKPTDRRQVNAREAPQRADPGLLRLASALDHVPVLLLGRRAEVLAHNALLSSVLGRQLNPGTSFVDYLFRDPSARDRIVNWAEFACTAVAAMRREVGKRPNDRRLLEAVADLRRADPDVARWWDDHAVRDYTSVTKRIAHPEAGILVFRIEIVVAPHDPDQHLIVYTTEPDSPTAQLLPILASWVGESSGIRPT
jgi:hypothetical protein